MGYKRADQRMGKNRHSNGVHSSPSSPVRFRSFRCDEQDQWPTAPLSATDRTRLCHGEKFGPTRHRSVCVAHIAPAIAKNDARSGPRTYYVRPRREGKKCYHCYRVGGRLTELRKTECSETHFLRKHTFGTWQVIDEVEPKEKLWSRF